MRAFPWRGTKLSRYEALTTEILLQRTRAEAVRKFWDRFYQAYPTWESLASAKWRGLRDILRPIGLSARRADALLALGRAVRARNYRVPDDRQALEELPGVGQYVCSAYLAVECGGREPMLDGSMARLLDRVFEVRTKSDLRYDSQLQALARAVLPPKRVAWFNWAQLDLAALVCQPNRPRCSDCPLAPRCPTAGPSSSVGARSRGSVSSLRSER